MSLTSLLSIARGALLAHQKAVSVVGHNIANAETPGYTAQRPRLAAATPESFLPLGFIGRGVELVGIERLRSSFYDQSWRRETAVSSQYRTLQQNLEQISGILGEPSDAGLSASLDGLIDSFHTLATNPVDPAARAVVIANARALTDRFRAIDARLDGVAQNIGSELQQIVLQANALVGQINHLNTQIRAAGGHAPDLQDQRDAAVDQLSQFFDIRVLDRDGGTVDVLVGGLQLITSGGGTQPLSIAGSGPFDLRLGDPPVSVTATGGQVKGLFDAATILGVRGSGTTRATGLRGQLDDLALAIVSAVNQIHSDYDPLTKPLQPTLTPPPAPLRVVGAFFDPSGVTASSIALNAAIVADPSQLAAGWSTAAGDSTIAARLAELRNLAVPIPGATAATASSPAVVAGAPAGLGEYYTGVVAGLGVATQDAATRAAAQGTLVEHLTSLRQQTSGVSIDEEMVRLIEHQQAYSAAARLVQVADEMLRELVNLGR
jgi:flagellar hook-associated protein 1 FlgK